ncbi:MAG: DUF5659 domain-containing protein [Syntrophorhabdus sp.]
MATTKTFSTLDIYLSAFLLLYYLEPILEIRNGKVVFTFESTDRLYQLMNLYNSDEQVPVATFSTQIKTLRGKMLTAKESIKGYGKGDSHESRRIS